MNFNIYLKKDTGERVKKAAKSLHRTRNSIVNEALEEWLQNHTKTEWPKDFFNFPAIEDLPDFKSLRKDLLNNISEDPLS